MENQNNTSQTTTHTSQDPPVEQISPVQSPPIPKPKPKFPIIIALIIGILILLANVSFGFYLYKQQSLKQTACTMEAKVCPDGTSVGRSGPKCEFAPCTTTKNFPTPPPAGEPTANWKTYTNTQYGYTVKYPSNIAFKQDRFYFFGDDNRKDTADGFGPNLSILYRSDTEGAKEAAVKELGNIMLKPFSVNNATGVEVANLSSGFDYYLLSPSNSVLRIIFSTQDYSPTVSKDKIQEMKDIASKILSTFKFAPLSASKSPDGILTPTPTCMIRPACLDATPRCMIPEPANGWCPDEKK